MLIDTSTSDFEQIYGHGFLYVDKTKFLIDWWKKGNKVTLITRPRRFGKSLLLSTVDRFFRPMYKDLVKEDGTPLFEGLDVWEDKKMRAVHGTVPVISMTLSGMKQGRPEEVVEAISRQIQMQYRMYTDILRSERLIDEEKAVFRDYIRTGSTKAPGYALQFLCQTLWLVYGTKPILLLDEYDTPLTESFVKGSFAEVMDELRSFFVTAFKDNDYFSKCLMTGITRIAQQSLFSDFNNPKIDTMLSSAYPTALGYTEGEVISLLEQAGRMDLFGLIKKRYDGYSIGTQNDIYNPFSLNHFLSNGDVGAYWVRSSENTLAREVIRNGISDIQEKVMALMEGQSISTELPADLNYKNLYSNPSSAFSLLFSAGFLKYVTKRQDQDSFRVVYEVAIPNEEVRSFYKDVCLHWFEEDITNEFSPTRRFHKALLEADKNGMTQSLSELALSSIGLPDVANNPKHPPENFYHGLVLGLVAGLEKLYSVKSNGYGGFGRYDITMIPRLDNPRYQSGELYAFCIEFKVREKEEETLVHTVHRAIRQIKEKAYISPLLDLGIPKSRIKCFGIAFDGKDVLVGDGN